MERCFRPRGTDSVNLSLMIDRESNDVITKTYNHSGHRNLFMYGIWHLVNALMMTS
jgi:hypothetical protein